MDITEGAKSLFSAVTKTEEQLATASHTELVSMRDIYAGKENQNLLAKYEHRAFAREWIQEAGPVAALSLSLAVPTYTAAKASGILPSDEQTSTDYTGEIKQGYIGIGEGLKAFFQIGSKEENKPTIVPQGSPIKPDMDSLFSQLIQVESGGRHKRGGSLTESEKGALGITQVMPRTARNPGYGVKPLKNDSEEEYIRFGKDYLNAMYRVFQDMEQAVAAYNAGPGAVHRAVSKSQRTGKDWKEHLPKETKEYIKKVIPKEEPKKEEKSSEENNPTFTDVMGLRG